ncbi:MAG: hypothetical protein ACLU0O_00590 [Collinsella sp.]
MASSLSTTPSWATWPAEELFEQGFDAIYVATGAGLPKFLNVPGENRPTSSSRTSTSPA